MIRHGEGVKRLNHPTPGPIELEYSAFPVDGRPSPGMIVCNPVESAPADRIRVTIKSKPSAG